MIEISLCGTEAVDGHRTDDRPSLVQSDPALHQPAGAGPADRDGGEDPVHLRGGPGPRGRAEGLPRRQRRLHAHGPGSVLHHSTLWNCTRIYSYTIYILVYNIYIDYMPTGAAHSTVLNLLYFSMCCTSTS